MEFNTIHSLGSRCQNSDILKHYNYREFSGFFDFMNTHVVGDVIHMIKDDFNELLKDDNNVSLLCNQLTIEPETGVRLPTSIRTSNKYYNIDYNNIDLAIFPHHDLNNKEDKHHFIVCRDRFKKLVNYNVLFNYTYNTWENNISTDDMKKMVDALTSTHKLKNFKVCFIGVKIGGKIGLKKINTTDFYDNWELTINNGSFTGGLFSNAIDNENYINIIKTYNIADVRVTKHEIDGKI